MKCQTCNTIIPPEWKSAISSNLCPACGDKIYDLDVAELISGLADALSKMPNDFIGIAGWIVSNYEIRKIGEAKPVEKFYGKQKQQSDEENPSNKFLQRTNAYKNIAATQNKTNNKLAAMAAAIANGNIDEEMYGTGSSEITAPDDAPEIYENEEVPDVAVTQIAAPIKYQMPDRPSRALVTEAQLINSKVSLSDEELAAAYALAGGLDTGEVVSDNPVVTRELHQQRMKRVLSQQNFESGGGFIRRSGG